MKVEASASLSGGMATAVLPRDSIKVEAPCAPPPVRRLKREQAPTRPAEPSNRGLLATKSRGPAATAQTQTQQLPASSGLLSRPTGMQTVGGSPRRRSTHARRGGQQRCRPDEQSGTTRPPAYAERRPALRHQSRGWRRRRGRRRELQREFFQSKLFTPSQEEEREEVEEAAVRRRWWQRQPWLPQRQPTT